MQQTISYIDAISALGLSGAPTEREIKKAYHKLALQYHPDKQVRKSDTEKAAEEAKFKKISEAYEALTKNHFKSWQEEANVNGIEDEMKAIYQAFYKTINMQILSMNPDYGFTSPSIKKELETDAQRQLIILLAG